MASARRRTDELFRLPVRIIFFLLVLVGGKQLRGLLLPLLRRVFGKQLTLRPRPLPKTDYAAADRGLTASAHNVNRQAMLALQQPVDHLGAVLVVPDPHFDLSQTIFKTIRKTLATWPVRQGITKAIGNTMYWSEERAREVQQRCEQCIEAAAARPRPPPVSQLGAILAFMETECDFSVEHADGNFLDHLNFCRDYSALHYPEVSPRILFLHSILGVGTNVWPMPAAKMQQLQDLVTEAEFVHIQAFPTVLRLIKGTDFLEEVFAQAASGEIQGIEMERLLDGARISLSPEQLWVHLNLHLVHSLDFLPVAGWAASANDAFLQEFTALYVVLQRAGQLRARVALPAEFELDAADSLWQQVRYAAPPNAPALQGLPTDLVTTVKRALPPAVMRKIARKQIQDFCADAGCSLAYTWKG